MNIHTSDILLVHNNSFLNLIEKSAGLSAEAIPNKIKRHMSAVCRFCKIQMSIHGLSELEGNQKCRMVTSHAV